MSMIDYKPMFSVVDVKDDDIVSYIFTSGTTGLPKAARFVYTSL